MGDYRDFPVTPYGELASAMWPADWPFVVRQTMTDDDVAVQTALNMLQAGGGGDEPESGGEGLYRAVADPCPIPDRGFGAACFRTMSHPIIVLVSDAHLHNGPTPSYNYGSPPVPAAHTWAATSAALVANDVRVVGVGVPLLFIPPVNIADLRAVASATSSFDAAGGLTVYEATGTGVGAVVVNGIVDLVGATTQDVTSVERDDTADTVDAREFIQAITPLMASRPGVTFDATTFYEVPGGTTVTFDVTFQNDFLPPTSVVQIFRAYIDVHDLASMTVLDTRNVYIVVPPEGGILF